MPAFAGMTSLFLTDKYKPIKIFINFLIQSRLKIIYQYQTHYLLKDSYPINGDQAGSCTSPPCAGKRSRTFPSVDTTLKILVLPLRFA